MSAAAAPELALEMVPLSAADDELLDDAAEEPSWADRLDAAVSQQWQVLLDKSVPYFGRRWALAAVVALIYCIRVYLIQGWYIITYGLAIYQLSLLLGFLTPQVANTSHLATPDVLFGLHRRSPARAG